MQKICDARGVFVIYLQCAALVPTIGALRIFSEIEGASNQGYVTTGFGTKFRADAEMLCESIRHFNDTTPFALLTSEAEALSLEGHTCFSQIIPVVVNQNLTNPHERFNVDVMLRLYELSPFQETIFMDSDVLRTRECDLWSSMRQATHHQDQSVVLLGRRRDCNWHWGTACKLENRNNMSIPHTHAGLMYFKRGASSRTFFDLAQEANNRYGDLGFLSSLKGGSKCLEIHWSYAFGKMGWWPMEFDEQELFCFNWKPGEPVPPQRLGIADLEPTEARRYCHAHQFDDKHHVGLAQIVMER